nr:hypothetical protein SHINE37_100157 [Rhizobiaceae bacterium]
MQSRPALTAVAATDRVLTGTFFRAIADFGQGSPLCGFLRLTNNASSRPAKRAPWSSV